MDTPLNARGVLMINEPSDSGVNWIYATCITILVAGVSLLVMTIYASPAQAQNQHSVKILALTEIQRNALWTVVLNRSGEKCDRVVRTMFQGGTKDRDDSWSVGCADGNEYSAGLSGDAAGATRFLGCREMQALDAMLTNRLRIPPDNLIGCWKRKAAGGG
jgi:hypothetical protein